MNWPQKWGVAALSDQQLEAGLNMARGKTCAAGGSGLVQPRMGSLGEGYGDEAGGSEEGARRMGRTLGNRGPWPLKKKLTDFRSGLRFCWNEQRLA